MSFIQRELDRIGDALRADPGRPDYDTLYAAQQALAWATDPAMFKPPFEMITRPATEVSPEQPATAPHLRIG